MPYTIPEIGLENSGATRALAVRDRSSGQMLPLARMNLAKGRFELASTVSSGAMTVAAADGQDRALSDKIIDWGYTPYDFMSYLTPAQVAKVRNGAEDAPAVDKAFRDLYAFLLTIAGNTGFRISVPDGTYVFDKVAEFEAFSNDVNQRRYCLDISPGAKFVHSATNRYRYAVLGPWDAAASPGMISSMSGTVGDAFMAVSAHDNLNIDGIQSINVGDTAYRGVNGWQKILCKADYHHQFWDASTNLDGAGNLVILPGIGREGECYIVGKSGSANIGGGVSSWAIGDEAIYIFGQWRKKAVRGGTFKGYWHASTNTTYSDAAGTQVLVASPALNNSPTDPKGGNPGDWYIVIGYRAVDPIDLGGNYVTGLGENYILGAGQKVWCIARGKWHKCSASPTPRGRWNPVGDTYRSQYYPATRPAANVSTRTHVGPDQIERPFGGVGEYGATFEITFPGTGTVNGMTRAWRRGEYIFRGPNGYEFIARDPNYDCGIFLFHIDDKSAIHVHGTFAPISRDASGLTGGYSAGVALRVWSVYRPGGYDGYLFGSPMLWIKGTLFSESDDKNAGVAAGLSGIWEKLVETKFLYLPRIEDIRVRAAYALGQPRANHARDFPRTTVNVVHHTDAYVGVIAGGNINGPYFEAIRFDSDCWNQEQYSYEGGHVVIDGASMMTMLYVSHNWRETPGTWRSTFEVEMGDIGFSEYAVWIKGQTGVRIKLNRPILPGISGIKDFFTLQPAAVMLEDCSSIYVDAGIPAAGTIIDANTFSSVLRTRGNVTDVSIRGDFGQMDGGSILNLAHNGNENATLFYFGFPQQYPDSNALRDKRVTLKDTTGIVADTVGKVLLRGPRSLLQGERVILDLILNENLVMKQGKGLVMGPLILTSGPDRLYFQRTSDGALLASIDRNGTFRSLGGFITENPASGA